MEQRDRQDRTKQASDTSDTETIVISLGGSLIMPGEIDTAFISRFCDCIRRSDNRFILICGGGKICRLYQDAARKIYSVSKEDLDWIGISSTRLNAELIRAVLSDISYKKIILDPYEDLTTDKKVIVGGGFEPGSSTDLRAVQIAERFNASTVINMSNIDYVYSADPKKDLDAKKIEEIDWDGFRTLVGDEWDPGLNMPFDPIASKEAQRIGLKVIIIGKDLDNLQNVFDRKAFKGTEIS